MLKINDQFIDFYNLFDSFRLKSDSQRPEFTHGPLPNSFPLSLPNTILSSLNKSD